MKAQPQNTNICPTCIYASECVHYQNSQIACKPIWFCENFDNTASLQVAENEEIYLKERSSQSSKPGIVAISGRMKGLCINCDNRASCLFPIVEGGVWHCEEYC
ncbi:hypothetical protein ACFL2S_02990 [Thermodesulfobacteriota bacterium]